MRGRTLDDMLKATFGCSSTSLVTTVAFMARRTGSQQLMTEDDHEIQSSPFRDQDDDRPDKLEQFLNSLEGEIVAIIPNVTLGAMWAHRVDFLLIVEKLA